MNEFEIVILDLEYVWMHVNSERISEAKIAFVFFVHFLHEKI